MKDIPYDFTGEQGDMQVERQADFDQFDATELYCPKCGTAVPVRSYLLLVLPEGDKYEYRCRYCGTTVGDKTDRSGDFYGVLRR